MGDRKKMILLHPYKKWTSDLHDSETIENFFNEVHGMGFNSVAFLSFYLNNFYFDPNGIPDDSNGLPPLPPEITSLFNTCLFEKKDGEEEKLDPLQLIIDEAKNVYGEDEDEEGNVYAWIAVTEWGLPHCPLTYKKREWSQVDYYGNPNYHFDLGKPEVQNVLLHILKYIYLRYKKYKPENGKFKGIILDYIRDTPNTCFCDECTRTFKEIFGFSPVRLFSEIPAVVKLWPSHVAEIESSYNSVILRAKNLDLYSKGDMSFDLIYQRQKPDWTGKLTVLNWQIGKSREPISDFILSTLIIESFDLKVNDLWAYLVIPNPDAHGYTPGVDNDVKGYLKKKIAKQLISTIDIEVQCSSPYETAIVNLPPPDSDNKYPIIFAIVESLKYDITKPDGEREKLTFKIKPGDGPIKDFADSLENDYLKNGWNIIFIDAPCSQHTCPSSYKELFGMTGINHDIDMKYFNNIWIIDFDGEPSSKNPLRILKSEFLNSENILYYYWYWIMLENQKFINFAKSLREIINDYSFEIGMFSATPAYMRLLNKQNWISWKDIILRISESEENGLEENRLFDFICPMFLKRTDDLNYKDLFEEEIKRWRRGVKKDDSGCTSNIFPILKVIKSESTNYLSDRIKTICKRFSGVVIDSYENMKNSGDFDAWKDAISDAFESTECTSPCEE